MDDLVEELAEEVVVKWIKILDSHADGVSSSKHMTSWQHQAAKTGAGHQNIPLIQSKDPKPGAPALVAPPSLFLLCEFLFHLPLPSSTNHHVTCRCITLIAIYWQERRGSPALNHLMGKNRFNCVLCFPPLTDNRCDDFLLPPDPTWSFCSDLSVALCCVHNTQH